MSDALVERLAGVLVPVLIDEYGGAEEDWTAMRSLRRVAQALLPVVEQEIAAARADALREAARGARNYPSDLDLGDAPARGDWWIHQEVGLWLENRAARIARTATSPEEER